MKYRTLGKGLKVSALGLGCLPMVGKSGSVNYGAATEDESIATIHRAIDLGVTLLDTAEAYGPHVNEELVGRAIRGRRDGLVIATKFCYRTGDDGVRRVELFARKRPSFVDASLARLGLDAIDLFYQHRVDPGVAIEETEKVRASRTARCLRFCRKHRPWFPLRRAKRVNRVVASVAHHISNLSLIVRHRRPSAGVARSRST